jgi:hypothetical protein
VSEADYIQVGIMLILIGTALVLGSLSLWLVMCWHEGRNPKREVRSWQHRRRQQRGCEFHPQGIGWRPDFGVSDYWFCAHCGKKSRHTPLPVREEIGQ